MRKLQGKGEEISGIFINRNSFPNIIPRFIRTGSHICGSDNLSVSKQNIAVSHEFILFCMADFRYDDTLNICELINLLTNLLYETEYYSRGHQLCSNSIVSQHLWNPEVQYRIHKSSYHEPEQSIPHHPITTLQDYYPTTYVFAFLVNSFSLAFLPITYTRSSSSLFVLHSSPISTSSI
jgi:hypothetical protein